MTQRVLGPNLGLLRRLMTVLPLAAILGACAVTPSPSLKQPTEIVVRAISRDAKFVGDTMGGVRIILRDVESGEVLANGVTSGGTGDTGLLMESATRRKSLATAGAAAFHATIDINQPRLVELEAYGPLDHPQSAVRVTSQQWILPGRHVRDGNGWMVEMPGFVVDILEPDLASSINLASGAVALKVNVVMMCGCPTSPGGTWDADRYEILAMIDRDGAPLASLPLSYTGTTSQYALSFSPDEPGRYSITVQVFDADTGNAGIDRTSFTVTAK